jgi:flagellar basal-body rod protein FlgC
MMGAFDAMDIAATGANLSQDWMDVLAHNLANINTVRSADEEPFRASLIYATERIGGPGVAGSGVQAVRLLESAADPVVVFDPSHPLADEEGNVVLPVVDMAGQMADLIVAQRAYQMNLQVIRNAQEAYQNALRIGSR